MTSRKTKEKKYYKKYECVYNSINTYKIQPLRNNEMLMINVATATSVGVTRNAEKTRTNLELRLPICVDSGQRVSLSRRIGSRWRLIGYGIIE